MSARAVRWLALAGAFLACRSVAEQPAPARFPHPFTDAEVATILAMGDLGDPPPDPTNAYADDPRAAHLGQYLFFDERLSGDGTIACATCHEPERAWTDGQPLGRGLETLRRHTPSLLNAAFQRWFLWDGRADSLWSQALVPLEDPREHGGSRLQYAHLIHDDAELRAAYERIFGPLPDLADRSRFAPEGRPVSGDSEHPHQLAWAAMTEADREQVDRVFVNVGKSIAAFERRLVSRSSAFDAYAAALRRGDAEPPEEFSPRAVRGLGLFLDEARCRNCHHGALFSDREFHNTLVPARSPELMDDGGRFDGAKLVIASEFNGIGRYSDDPTGDAAVKIRYLSIDGDDHAKFKTPSLRNVAATPPYMHQGQFETLEDVVRYYSTLEQAVRFARHPDPLMQPLELSEDEIADLVAFLETLTDTRVPDELATQPASPIFDLARGHLEIGTHETPTSAEPP